jgi:3-phenylpropionate/trans-cinnamate dioxygenase ferredoxin subunit
MSRWVEVCEEFDVDPEDVIPVQIEGLSLAVYRSPSGEFYTTDGFCTHERFLLADGLVMGSIIECPKHNGRFDYTTGEGKGAPICENLRTYQTRCVEGHVEVDLGD